MKLNFGEWLPDVGELDTDFDGVPTLAVARNVYPGANSYLPVAGADTAYSDALPADPRGLWLVQKESGAFEVFGGTATTLQKLSAAVWGSVGTGYAVPDDELWSGKQFGTKLICTNFTNGPQVYDIEAGGSFSALGGSPPTGRIVDVIEDYLVLASTSVDPFGIAWCDTNDATNWSTGNSGTQTFADGGRVQNFAGAAGLVIQERTIRRMIHSPGSAEVFQFYKVAQAKGAIAPYSVIKFGDQIGYLAEDGFWFAGENIGAHKVNDYFFGNIDRNRLFSVLGVADPGRPIFYWLYRSTSAATYDFGLMYNWKVKRWAELDVDMLFAGDIATPGVTLEELAAAYPDIETVPYSFDSRVWQGGRPVFVMIDTARKLAFFEGSNLEATLETGEREFIPGRRALIRSVRPLVDTSAAVVAIGHRERQADSRTWSSEASMATSGRNHMKIGGRLNRVRVRIPSASTWTDTKGIDIVASGGGSR